MRVVGVIPARYGSTRFPGKLLVKILGKPMIQWVLEGALESRHLDKVVLATDHEGIAAVARRLGVQVVMTPPDLPSGTDRVYHAVKEEPPDLVVNIQGDEPLIRGHHVDAVVRLLQDPPPTQMATLVYPNPDPEGPDRVKVVMDLQGFALYFSRSPIPYHRTQDPYPSYWIHIGIYGYRWEALTRLVTTPPTPLETIEGLEQLRALQMQMKIKVGVTEDPCIPVDRPEDVMRVEQRLRARTTE